MIVDYLAFEIAQAQGQKEYLIRIPQKAYSASQFGKTMYMRVCQFYTKHKTGVEQNDISLFAKNLPVRNMYNPDDTNVFLSGELHYNLAPLLRITEQPQEICLIVKNINSSVGTSWERAVICLEIQYEDEELEYPRSYHKFMDRM